MSERIRRKKELVPPISPLMRVVQEFEEKGESRISPSRLARAMGFGLEGLTRIVNRYEETEGVAIKTGIDRKLDLGAARQIATWAEMEVAEREKQRQLKQPEAK